MAASSQPTTVRPSRSELDEVLNRIFASAGFAQAERMRRFLRFIVQRTLDGNEDDLKESVIGVQVFDREIGYDPKTDSIVRVEARRLRNKLHEYQREGGSQDGFWIVLPKGGYVPEFVRREPAAPNRENPAHRPSGARLIYSAALVALVVLTAAWLLLRNGRPTAPLQGHPFTTWPGYEVTPAFSPDGQTIAFASGAIYTQRIGADQAVRLTHSASTEIEPVWSPDGRAIAFFRMEQGGILGIYILAVDGSGERRLSSVRNGSAVARMDWSKDGRYLAAATRESESRTRLVLISVSTGEKSWPLPDHELTTETCPRFSPDGSQLAYVRGLRDSVEDVYVLPLNSDVKGVLHTRIPRRITFDNRKIYGIAWAADGRTLIAASLRAGGSYQLWRISASGGDAVQLTAGVGADAIQPAVSRKANRLAYVSRFTSIGIWRAPIGGAAPSRQLIASTMSDTDPQYSPDGKHIAFRSDRSGYSGIWIADAEGGGVRRVTDFKGPPVGPPRWSPDGQWLAFDSRWGEETAIYVAPTDGSAAPHRLAAPSGANNLLPNWSGDGRFLYFGSRRTGRWELWKQPVFGNEAEQLTTQGGFSAFESADGKVVYYSKGPSVAGIFKLPGEDLVLPSASAPMWGWILGRTGIYYVDLAREDVPADLRYFDFATRSDRLIGRTSAKPAVGGTSLTVSPDERWIGYAQVDRAGSDIILVEGFR
jgi:Tol biopolymer transport system component